MDTRAELARLYESSGIDLAEESASRLRRYVELIQEYGRRINLTGNLERSFLDLNLVLGSLQLLRLGPPSGHLVDVGSGAGVPGIPLAIVLPELEVTLVEVRQKRAAFLRQVVSKLGLARVSVFAGDVATFEAPQVDWAVSRAFRPPSEWLRIAVEIASEGGNVALYTTRTDWLNCSVPPELRLVDSTDDPTGPERILVQLVKSQT